MSFSPAAVESLEALVLGFAFAGLLATAFEWVSERRAGVHLLERGGLSALACVPVLVFSAPYIMVRNALRGRPIEHRPFHFVLFTTIIAGLWSLMSGRLVLDVTFLLTRA